MAHHSSSQLGLLSSSTPARAIRAQSNCGHQFFFIFSSLESHYSCRYACSFVHLFVFLFPTTLIELKTYPEPIQSQWRPNPPPVTPGSPLTYGVTPYAISSCHTLIVSASYPICITGPPYCSLPDSFRPLPLSRYLAVSFHKR
jgi:hypothetical protein